MSWPEAFRDLGTILGGTTVIAWLAKAIVSNVLSKDVEKYKRDLEHLNTQAIERLRNDLKMQALEHEVRFRTLSERQAEKISDIYALLDKLLAAVSNYVHWLDFPNEPGKAGKHQQVLDAAAKFQEVFYPSRLYFPEDLGNKIDAFFVKLAQITNDFRLGLKTEGTSQENVTVWSNAIVQVNAEAGPLFLELRAEFQRLIGIIRPQ